MGSFEKTKANRLVDRMKRYVPKGIVGAMKVKKKFYVKKLK